MENLQIEFQEVTLIMDWKETRFLAHQLGSYFSNQKDFDDKLCGDTEGKMGEMRNSLELE